jgi:hypothetical protein
MCFRLPARIALVAILLASGALAADPEPPDAPMSDAGVRALEAGLDRAGERLTRDLEVLIERRAERWVVAQLDTAGLLAPPAAPARHAPARARTRRAPEGCVFEADHVLSCQVLGSW